MTVTELNHMHYSRGIRAQWLPKPGILYKPQLSFRYTVLELLQNRSKEVVNTPGITGKCLCIITINTSLTAVAKVLCSIEPFISITAIHSMCKSKCWAELGVYVSGDFHCIKYTHTNVHTCTCQILLQRQHVNVAGTFSALTFQPLLDFRYILSFFSIYLSTCPFVAYAFVLSPVCFPFHEALCKPGFEKCAELVRFYLFFLLFFLKKRRKKKTIRFFKTPKTMGSIFIFLLFS